MFENVKFVVVAAAQIVPVPIKLIEQLLKLIVLVFEFDEDNRPTVKACPFASKAPLDTVRTPVAPVVRAEDNIQDPPTPLIVWLPTVLPA